MEMTSDSIVLVRHGEVLNPAHVVYADLPGFPLSATGRRQAEETAEHLPRGAVVVTSPLDRAVETATIIAEHTDGRVMVDDGLTEWALGSRWAGCVWEQLDDSFPGELSAYLDHPEHLPFSPEPLADLALRMAEAIARQREGSRGPLILVSHQDPIQAVRLFLTGRPLAGLNTNKPLHAEAITLTITPRGSWIERGSRAPDQDQVVPPESPTQPPH